MEVIEWDRDQCQRELGVARSTLYKYEQYPDYPEKSTNINQKNVAWPRDGILRFKQRLNERGRKKRAG